MAESLKGLAGTVTAFAGPENTDSKQTLAEVYEDFERRVEAHRRAMERAWTVGEVLAWERAAALNPANGARLEALRPAFEASHQRGEWRRPSEMTREQFRAYVLADPEREIVAPDAEVWSRAELSRLSSAADPYRAGGMEAFNLLRDALARAQREGRIQPGREGAPFPGETSADTVAALGEKLERWERFNKAQTTLREAEADVEVLEADSGLRGIVRSGVGSAIERVLSDALDMTDRFAPYYTLAGWSQLMAVLDASTNARPDSPFRRKLAGTDAHFAQLVERRKQARAANARLIAEVMGATS